MPSVKARVAWRLMRRTRQTDEREHEANIRRCGLPTVTRMEREHRHEARLRDHETMSEQHRAG